MKESGEAFTKTEAGGAPVKGEKEEEAARALQQHRQRRRRRRLAWGCGALLLLLVILGTVALILALVVFKIREPTATLNSVTLRGTALRLSLPLTVQLNLTLHLDLLIHNPNRASFSYASGDTAVLYNDIAVGSGIVQPGRIPARGDAHLAVNLTVDAVRFAEDLPALFQDLITWRLGLNTSTRIPGRVSFLGFIKRRAVIVSDCKFVVGGVPQPKILEQQCRQKTHL